MTSITNTKDAGQNGREHVATFRVELYRNGGKIEIETPSPKCYKRFDQFTVGERYTFQNIVAKMLDQIVSAATCTREEIASRMSENGGAI